MASVRNLMRFEEDAYRFNSVFISKRNNVNGQFFHLQKRKEMITDQCERVNVA